MSVFYGQCSVSTSKNEVSSFEVNPFEQENSTHSHETSAMKFPGHSKEKSSVHFSQEENSNCETKSEEIPQEICDMISQLRQEATENQKKRKLEKEARKEREMRFSNKPKWVGKKSFYNHRETSQQNKKGQKRHRYEYEHTPKPWWKKPRHVSEKKTASSSNVQLNFDDF